MKHFRMTDVFTKEQIKQITEIGPNHDRLLNEIILPNMGQINQNTGQENDPNFMAYMLEFVLMTA